MKKEAFKTRNAAGGRYRVTWTVRRQTQRAIVPSLAVAQAMRKAHAEGGDPWAAMAAACAEPADGGACEHCGAVQDCTVDCPSRRATLPVFAPDVQARAVAILEAVSAATITPDEAFGAAERLIEKTKDPDFSLWRKAGRARAAKLSPERRREIAQAAGRARWANRNGSAV